MPNFVSTIQESRTLFVDEHIQIEQQEEMFFLKTKQYTLGPFPFKEDAEEARLFFAGIKPTLNVLVPDFVTIFPIELLQQYTFSFHQSQGMTQYMLFHDPKDLQRLDEAEDKADISQELFFESKKVLGQVLGYPTVATEDFVIRLKNLFNPYDWASIYYHGIRFVCREQHIDECAAWLEKTYVIPDKYKTEEFAQLL